MEIIVGIITIIGALYAAGRWALGRWISKRGCEIHVRFRDASGPPYRVISVAHEEQYRVGLYNAGPAPANGVELLVTGVAHRVFRTQGRLNQAACCS